MPMIAPPIQKFASEQANALGRSSTEPFVVKGELDLTETRIRMPGYYEGPTHDIQSSQGATDGSFWPDGFDNPITIFPNALSTLVWKIETIEQGTRLEATVCTRKGFPLRAEAICLGR